MSERENRSVPEACDRVLLQPASDPKTDSLGNSDSVRQADSSSSLNEKDQPPLSSPAEIVPSLKGELTAMIEQRELFEIYLKENFPSERAEDIASVQKTIALMKEPGAIAAQFPQLVASDAIGCSREKRNFRIETLLNDIQSRVSSASEPIIKKFLTTHYVEVVSILRKILHSQLAPLPLIVSRRRIIEAPDSNQELPPSVLKITPIKINPVPSGRVFYLTFELTLGSSVFSLSSGFSGARGEFGEIKSLDLAQRFSKDLISTSLLISLRKRKFMIGSREVSSVRLSLSKLENFCTFSESLIFPYKNGVSITAEVKVQIHKSFGKSCTEIEVLELEKIYPIFHLKKSEEAKTFRSLSHAFLSTDPHHKTSSDITRSESF